MTQLEAARGGRVTARMREAARHEGVDPEVIRAGVAAGRVVVLGDPERGRRPRAVGAGLTTKVSASVGTGAHTPDLAGELEKVRLAVEAGTDAIMDLSDAGDIDATRLAILGASPVPVGTLPFYQAAAQAARTRGSHREATPAQMFATLERQAADGVDFVALHAALSREVLAVQEAAGRLVPEVSYGGSRLAEWMRHHDAENPYHAEFDRVLEIARRHDLVLALADACRPGCLADSLDRAQVQELVVMGELAERSRRAGVQVLLKGPGHVPLHHLRATVQLAKKLSGAAPYFVFGPLATDVAAGYDHIAAAIGGAVAAAAGAGLLCYVTPVEHLGLPDAAAVRLGVVAARIAAHAADVAKDVSGARDWDRRMSEARKRLDWEEQLRLAIDPEQARRVRLRHNPKGAEACSMCGSYCAMKVVGEYLGAPEDPIC
jgi:phosphomethylpyrimidine synthase